MKSASLHSQSVPAAIVFLAQIFFVSTTASAQNKVPDEAHAIKAATQLISPQTQTVTLAAHAFTRVDEYYDSTTHVWSVIFVDDPKHPESFDNEIILNFYGWTPAPTPQAVANALAEERPRKKDISLFKAPDQPNGEMVYNVVSITQSRANFVNVMKISGWEKSAVTVDFSHRLGGGDDITTIESQAKKWLVSDEGVALRDAAAALHVGDGWRDYLKNVK